MLAPVTQTEPSVWGQGLVEGPDFACQGPLARILTTWHAKSVGDQLKWRTSTQVYSSQNTDYTPLNHHLHHHLTQSSQSNTHSDPGNTAAVREPKGCQGLSWSKRNKVRVEPGSGKNRNNMSGKKTRQSVRISTTANAGSTSLLPAWYRFNCLIYSLTTVLFLHPDTEHVKQKNQCSTDSKQTVTVSQPGASMGRETAARTEMSLLGSGERPRTDARLDWSALMVRSSFYHSSGLATISRAKVKSDISSHYCVSWGFPITTWVALDYIKNTTYK